MAPWLSKVTPMLFKVTYMVIVLQVTLMLLPQPMVLKLVLAFAQHKGIRRNNDSLEGDSRCATDEGQGTEERGFVSGATGKQRCDMHE
jgi:hypothetical protein